MAQYKYHVSFSRSLLLLLLLILCDEEKHVFHNEPVSQTEARHAESGGNALCTARVMTRVWDSFGASRLEE